MIETQLHAPDTGSYAKVLPVETYLDPARWTLERERIFMRGWQYVGLLSALTNVGDYFTSEVAGSPVFVIRTDDGEIRCYANVCPHRAAQLLPDGCGHRRAIQCPYHAWRFGLDGELRRAPRQDVNDGFSIDGIRLHELRVDTLGPLVFVNPDPDALPASATFDGWLERVLTAFDPNLELHATKRYPVKANWKVVVEGAFECYHCPTIHPSLSASMKTTEDLQFDFFGTYAMRKLLAQRSSDDSAAPSRDASGRLSFLWPNLFVIARQQRSMAAVQILPIDETSSILQRQFWFTDAVADDERESIMAFTEITDLEDVEIAEIVQRGLGSGFYSPGRLMMPSSEAGVAFHQNLVREAVGAAV